MASAIRRIEVGKEIGVVWTYVRDMANWAVQLPGYVSHREIDADNSVWTLRVNIGPVQRTVDVAVQVLRWDEPGEVEFRLKGVTESFSGSGLYQATQQASGTRIDLHFSATPEGPMATMVEALAAPVLAQVADDFSENLRRSIDGEAITRNPSLRISLFRRWIAIVMSWFGRSEKSA